MLEIMQGDQYPIEIAVLDDEKNPIDARLIEAVEVVLDGVRKLYPGEITYDSTNRVFDYPLTQEESFAMSDGSKDFQVRVKMDNRWIIGKELPTVVVRISQSKKEL